MPALLDLQVAVPEALDEAWASGVVEAACAGAGRESMVVGVVLTDDATIRELNREHRGIDDVTDVLSFSLTEGEEFPSIEGETAMLGELVISFETATRQAAEHERTVGYEVAHLTIHGVLHLLGHDHAEAEEEAAMRGIEDRVLEALFGTADGRGWDKS